MVRLSRVGIIYLSLLLFGGALVARAAQVQLWQGALWAERAEKQHFKAAKVPAPRGAGTLAALKCCLSARSAHSEPCQSWTWAARATSAPPKRRSER